MALINSLQKNQTETHKKRSEVEKQRVEQKGSQEQFNNEVDRTEFSNIDNKATNPLENDKQNSNTTKFLGNNITDNLLYYMNRDAVENKCPIEDKAAKELWSTKNRCLEQLQKLNYAPEAQNTQFNWRDYLSTHFSFSTKTAEPTLNKFEDVNSIALEFQINNAFKNNGIVQIIKSLNKILEADNTYKSLNKNPKKSIANHILDKKPLDNHNLLYLLFSGEDQTCLTEESQTFFKHLAFDSELGKDFCDF